MHKLSKYFQFFICVFVSIIWLLPQIVLPHPSLLDVVETWSFRTNIVSNILGEFTNDSRFRPMYVFTHTVANVVFQYQSQWYFVGLAMVLAMTIYIFIKIIYPKWSQWIIVGIPLVYLFISPVTIDTYWRLGTAENFFALFLLLALFFLIRQRYTLALIFTLLLMVSKETSMFYIPAMLLYFIWKKRTIESLVLGVFYAWYCVKVYSLARYAHVHLEAYTSLFSIDPTSVWDMFTYYISTQFFYIELFFISVLLSIVRMIKSEKYRVFADWPVDILIFLTFCSGICSILFFHNKNWPYYFFPALVSGMLLFSRELIRASKSTQMLVITVSLLLFIFTDVPTLAYNRAIYWNDMYVNDGILISKIENSIDTTKYEFAHNYWGGQYQLAIDQLYTMKSSANTYKQTYGIVDSTMYSKPREAELLCAPSFFHNSPLCKWAVYEK